MFSYIIIEEGPMVQILHGDNVIDECGPWESLTAAINWAISYVNLKNAGIQEPESEV
jgi:hypothetical protein